MNESKKDSGTIRNIDMKEYHAKQKEKMTKIEQVDEQEENFYNHNEVDDTDDTPIYKKQTSRFEPEGELCKLPSGGISIDPKFIENGGIKLRRTTTKEEDIIFEYINQMKNFDDINDVPQLTHELMNTIDRVLESCVKTNISIGELLIIDREALFNFVIALGYGRKQILDFKCKECGINELVEFDLIDDVEVKYLSESKIEYPNKIELKSYPDKIAELRHAKINETSMLFDSNTTQTKLFQKITIKLYDKNTNEQMNDDDIFNIMDNLNNEDRITIRNWFDSIQELGITYKVTKKSCKNPNCKMHNKKQDSRYSLEYLLLNVIKIKNAII